MKDLKHAEDVLDLIRTSMAERGYPPSQREIQEALGHESVSTTNTLINNMVSRGLISRAPGVARGLRVVAVAATEPV